MHVNELMRKYSRFLITSYFLLLLTGILIIVVGVSVKSNYREYEILLDDFFSSDILIIIGGIILGISFFGCCCALMDNVCMTVIFWTLLSAVLLLEMIVGIGGFLLKYKTEGFIEHALNKTMQEYDQDNFNEVTAMWDKVQTDFACCGIHYYTDWFYVNSTHDHGEIPLSCCTFPPGTVGPVICTADKKSGLHQVSCLDSLSSYFKHHITSLEVLGLSMAIIQLLGILLSCYLSKQIKTDYEEV